MPTNAQHYTFQSSFWSPTASLDKYPDFKHGFEILASRLTQSIEENKMILQYIQQRIESERIYATSLRKLKRPPQEEAMTGLARCFGVVCAESETSAKEHLARADNLHTTALDPLQRLATRYHRQITTSTQRIRSQLSRFDTLLKQLDTAQSQYRQRCQTLVAIQPNYRLNIIRIGTRVFHDRFWIEDWLRPLEETMDRERITHWLQTEQQPASVLHDLIALNCIRQIGHDRFEKSVVSTSRSFSGFFLKRNLDSEGDMLQADKVYKDLVLQVDSLRTQLEEGLLAHYEEMGQLELDRIETLKQVFISLAASLSNTIPRYKETVDNMMLYQETLKPDKDVQSIVEQHRTGQFCPRPILYDNYFYGTAQHQLFGVPLDELTRTEGTFIPHFISKALTVIESGISKLEDQKKSQVWCTALALDRVHAARKEINQEYPNITIESFQTYDLPLVVSLVKLYLMELPDCLLTFELYEPCKLLYANQHQDKESRLKSLSKLLSTLPSANYHVCRYLFSHIHTFIKDHHRKSLAHSLSYILLRPQTESNISTFERHPHRLIQDLMEHFDDIFTDDALESNRLSHNSFDSKRRTLNGHLIPSSSTLFEDPDDLMSNSTPCLVKDTSEESTSLDSFFLDD